MKKALLSKEVVDQLVKLRAQSQVVASRARAAQALYEQELAEALVGVGLSPDHRGSICFECGLVRDARSLDQQGRPTPCSCQQRLTHEEED